MLDEKGIAFCQNVSKSKIDLLEDGRILGSTYIFNALWPVHQDNDNVNLRKTNWSLSGI